MELSDSNKIAMTAGYIFTAEVLSFVYVYM